MGEINHTLQCLCFKAKPTTKAKNLTWVGHFGQLTRWSEGWITEYTTPIFFLFVIFYTTIKNRYIKMQQLVAKCKDCLET